MGLGRTHLSQQTKDQGLKVDDCIVLNVQARMDLLLDLEREGGRERREGERGGREEKGRGRGKEETERV